jgi:hypothetical protein
MRSKRIRRRFFSSPRWAIERIEDRTLLTGNVIAHVVAGNLVVVGDNKANEIGLQSTSGGKLELVSLDGTTTINGSSSPFTTSAVTGGVSIALGSGNDVVDVGDTSLATSLPHGLLIILGNGADQVQIENTSIGGSIVILGGNGGDTIAIGSPSTSADVSVGADVAIVGGNGADTIAVFDADITDDLAIIDGNGNDHVQVGFDEGLGIIGQDEDATGHVNVGHDLSITVGSGLDHVAVADVNVTNNLIVVTGNGSDEVLLGAAHTPDTDQSPFTSLVYGQVTVGGSLTVLLADPPSLFGPSFSNSFDNFCGTNVNLSSIITFAEGQGSESTAAWCCGFGGWCGGRTDPSVASETNTLLLVDVTVNGNTTITASGGNNQIGVLDGPTFGGAFTIVTGSGNDSIVLASNGFLGKVLISSGGGTDTIGLAQNYFQSAVTVTGGSGSDTFLQTQNQAGFANTYVSGPPTVISIANNLPNETPTQFADAFTWLSALLGL